MTYVNSNAQFSQIGLFNSDSPPALPLRAYSVLAATSRQSEKRINNTNNLDCQLEATMLQPVAPIASNSLAMKILLSLLTSLTFATISTAQIAVIGSLAHDNDAAPGARYSGTVELHNNGTESRQAKIFQTDYSFNYEGANSFDAPGSVDRSNANWVTFNPSFVTIPPGESVPVAYEVVVPSDTVGAMAGSYWSVLMIEDVPADSPESTIKTNREEIQVGIREVFRYAVQIATHIRTHEEFNIEFIGVGLVNETDQPRSLRVAVANAGNAFVRPDVWIEVFDGAGKKRAKIDGKAARLYPETSVSHLFDLSGFEAGEYEVLVVVDAGDDNVFGAQYSVAL